MKLLTCGRKYPMLLRRAANERRLGCPHRGSLQDERHAAGSVAARA